MVGALKAASYKENLPSPLASDPNLPNLKFSAVSLSVYREAQNSLLEMRPRVLGSAKPQQTRAVKLPNSRIPSVVQEGKANCL